MSPRTGRPKSNNPKSIDIKVRIDNDTNTLLNSICQRLGKTRAEIIRESIIVFLDKHK